MERFSGPSCISKSPKKKTQPVFPYHPQSYPPRGRIWPQFGDDVLEDTLSLSEGAKQSLNRKKEGMGDFHKENLQYQEFGAQA